jgi:glycosyltransferase involved in cell wall biosynthesis
LSYFTFGNEYYTGLFPLLSLCLKLIGKSVVVTIHDIVPKSNITNDFLKNYTSPRFLEFKRWALFYYTIIVCSIVDKLILHSEIAQNVLTQDYAVPKKKIDIISHGIDQLSFPVDKDGKPKSLVREGCQLVSYFGLVRRGKGLEDLVRAWKKTENINAQLFIIGGKHPALKDNCYENLAILTKALGLEKSIRFCGYIPPESLSTYFIESDAFVFPYNEWGDVVASSGALSTVAPYLKPIIATDVPAFDDLKKIGAAIMVRRGNVEDLASAITEVLADAQIRNSLVTRLNGWLLEASWSKVAEKTAALYRELV